jgi:hypothetical protein
MIRLSKGLDIDPSRSLRPRLSQYGLESYRLSCATTSMGAYSGDSPLFIFQLIFLLFFCLLLSFFASWCRLDLCTFFNLRSHFVFLLINVCVPSPSLFKTAVCSCCCPAHVCCFIIACLQLPSHCVKNDVHNLHRWVIVKSLIIIIIVKSL